MNSSRLVAYAYSWLGLSYDLHGCGRLLPPLRDIPFGPKQSSCLSVYCPARSLPRLFPCRPAGMLAACPLTSQPIRLPARSPACRPTELWSFNQLCAGLPPCAVPTHTLRIPVLTPLSNPCSQIPFLDLCAAKIRVAELAMERGVSSLAVQRDHRVQEGTAGNRTVQLERGMRKTVKAIRAALLAYTVWNETAGRSTPALSEEDVLSNNLPWYADPGGSNSLDHVKLKLFKLQSELDRTEEELQFLHTDAVKVLLYFGKQIGLLQSWFMENYPEVGNGPLPGRVLLMYDLLQKVKRLQSGAYKLFIKNKLVLPK